MNVKVEVLLASFPTKADYEGVLASAMHLTNNSVSVKVHAPEDVANMIVAEFTVNKAKQIDIVDEISTEFKYCVRNYSESTICFPHPARQPRETITRNSHKEGQYLSFIYFYTKLNGRAPAELDMQQYFKSTPPTVHSMVVKLCNKGLIERSPGVARSIRLLLSRHDIPDLD